MSDPVTAFRGHYHYRGDALDGAAHDAAIAECALDAWLAAANDRGLSVNVLERFAPAQESTYAVVEIDGTRYAVRQHGRGNDVEAHPLP
ncbi:hypothetical protein [Nocardia salmonicida]|uniref:hypothetical protein n=1 Tax=Nocardia salmonicida TaxID=53431 RepID=UPI0007A504AC|nr:hypothetical protein [Nocardia salmonicida]